MKIFNIASLSQKIARHNLWRSHVLEENRGRIHPLFYIMDVYLGAFYKGILEDRNAKEVLKAFAKSETARFDVAQGALVFWFFWSKDRLSGHKNLLNQRSVINGFEQVWRIDPNLFNHLIASFDSLEPDANALYLWSLIQEALEDDAVSPILAFPHISNAQKIADLHSLSSKEYLDFVLRYYSHGDSDDF